MLLETIKSAIRRDPRTRRELCRLAEIDQGQMSRLMAGKTGISLAAAERLCAVLGLELIRGWIPVDAAEKPNEDETFVLLYQGSDRQWLAFGHYEENDFVDEEYEYDDDSATHWTRLPSTEGLSEGE